MKNLFIGTVLLALWSCASTKPRDTNQPPVPSQGLTSEIRDIHLLGWEASGERDLHLQGQLYTKLLVSDTVQVVPCDSCLVRIQTKSLDTVVKTRIGGSFLFNGPLGVYNLSLSNKGQKELEISGVDFSEGGINRISIVNATGEGKEQFTVSRNEHNYTWVKR